MNKSRVSFEYKKNKSEAKSVTFLSENLKAPQNASIAFDRSNANELIPTPYYKQKEQE